MNSVRNLQISSAIPPEIPWKILSGITEDISKELLFDTAPVVPSEISAEIPSRILQVTAAQR